MQRSLRTQGLPEALIGGETRDSVKVAGRRFEFTFHDLILPFMLLMRITFGWLFLWAGIDKLINDWTAKGWLLNVTSGPLKGWFEGMAGSAVVDQLVIWGLVLIGVALILGAATRLASLAGASMMFLFYLAQFPPEHNPFMNEYLVYILVFAMLSALGAGRILGADQYVERLTVIKRFPVIKYLLG